MNTFYVNKMYKLVYYMHIHKGIVGRACLQVSQSRRPLHKSQMHIVTKMCLTQVLMLTV